MKKTILQILIVAVLVFSLLGVFIACDKAATDNDTSTHDYKQTFTDKDEGVDFILLTVYGDGYVNKYNPIEVTIYPDKTIIAKVAWDMGTAFIYTDLNRASVIVHYNE